MPPVFESCFSELRCNGKRLYLKGVNFFGFETTDYTLHGLWCKPLSFLLDFVASNDFNALRVPVSAELVEGLDSIKPTNIDFSSNPELRGTTAGQQLDLLVSEAAKRGLLVLLDLHHQAAAKGITELWYDEQWPEERVISSLVRLCERYKSSWNVFAIDLNNEPHGRAAWGSGCPKTDWRLGAERLGAAVLGVAPRLLIFCEGTSGNAQPLQCPEPCFWGGGLCSAVEAPVRLPVARRLVLSPHVYGPGVFMQSYFSDPRFPENMPEIWEKQWAFAKTKASPPSEVNEAAPAIVVGEFGGKFESGLERCWVVSFADFLRKTALTDTFFWCLNPNSGDTGGLLKDDWSGPRATAAATSSTRRSPSSGSTSPSPTRRGTTESEEFKLKVLKILNPSPTKFDAEGNVLSAGGGKGYDPVATPLPAEVLAEIEAGRGQGGGGGGGAVAAVASDGAGQTSLPAPVATTHPDFGVTVTVSATKSWPSGPRTALQCDVRIKNESTSRPLPVSFKFSCDAASVEQSWNCTRLPDSGGRAVFGLPDWALANGGIEPGGELTAGGVFFDAPPSFDVALS